MYEIGEDNRRSQTSQGKSFILSLDEYHLFWKQNNYSSSRDNQELNSKEIADIIWNEWLESVGIG